jgi:hypothetical protein
LHLMKSKSGNRQGRTGTVPGCATRLTKQ